MTCMQVPQGPEEGIGFPGFVVSVQEVSENVTQVFWNNHILPYLLSNTSSA